MKFPVPGYPMSGWTHCHCQSPHSAYRCRGRHWSRWDWSGPQWHQHCNERRSGAHGEWTLNVSTSSRVNNTKLSPVSRFHNLQQCSVLWLVTQPMPLTSHSAPRWWWLAQVQRSLVPRHGSSGQWWHVQPGVRTEQVPEDHLWQWVLEFMMEDSVELLLSVQAPANHASCPVSRDESRARLTPLQDHDAGGVYCLQLHAGVVMVGVEIQLPRLTANGQHLHGGVPIFNDLCSFANISSFDDVIWRSQIKSRSKFD